MNLESRGRLFLLTSVAMAIGSALSAATSVGLEPALVAVAGAGLALALGTLGAHILTVQTVRLTEAARLMASGDLSRRVTPEESGEFQELGAAINGLVDKLERATVDLRSERNRMAVVLEGLVEGVIGLTSDGRIALCNRAATTMLDLQVAPMDRRFLDLVRQPALQDLLADARAALATPGTQLVVPMAEITMPGGQRLQWTALPLDRAGIGILLGVRDVTVLRRLETMRRDFISNVSHELRTPVATVYAAAEALTSGGLDEPAVARDFVGTILRHAERMSRIIADLLDLSRLEAGVYDVTAARLPVRERLEHAVHLLEPTAQSRSQTISVALIGEPVVRGHQAALDQVLTNLLENASKYSPPGARLEIGARALGGKVELWIADDGPGIAPHHRERIFERFYRIDAGRSRELGGTGLGLAIVRHLVEAMGGVVACEANEPKGARFVVTLSPWVATSGVSGEAVAG